MTSVNDIFFDPMALNNGQEPGRFSTSRKLSLQRIKSSAVQNGGEGSGNFGHGGRPGEVGGSAEGSFHGIPLKDVITREQSGTKLVSVKGKDAAGNPMVTEEQRPVYRWMQNGQEIKDQTKLDRINKLARVRSPAYEQIHISADSNARLQAVAVAKNGKVQSVYSAAHEHEAAAQKFARVKQFTEDIDGLRTQARTDATAGKTEGVMLRIMDKTTMRIGGVGEYENLGGYQSYGLTTLERRHVSVNGDDIRFQFTGKAGVQWDRTITDPVSAKFLAARLKELPSDDAPVFYDVNAGKFNGYLSKLSGDKYTAKDFRTYHATRIALGVIEGFSSQGSASLSKAERGRIIKAASEAASAMLGNTPAEARAKYIDPTVWDALPQSLSKKGN